MLEKRKLPASAKMGEQKKVEDQILNMLPHFDFQYYCVTLAFVFLEKEVSLQAQGVITCRTVHLSYMISFLN